MKNAISLRNISKSFGDNKVITSFNLDIQKNTFTTLSGKSGCGKTTLLNLIGLLDKPDEGDIVFNESEIIKPYSKKANYYLRERIGYLFQNFALVEDQTVEYNINIAQIYKKISKKEKEQRVISSLKKVGLEDYGKKKVFTCSGGEQQRIALARLLVKECDIILADEPTGSLDDDNKQIVLGILKDLLYENKTIIVVTHDKEIIKVADKNISL